MEKHYEIPEAFKKFAKEFAEKKEQVSTGSYYSEDAQIYQIDYVDYFENSMSPTRVKNTNGVIEVNKSEVLFESEEYLIFLLYVAFLTYKLDKYTENKYPENLLMCDLIAINECVKDKLLITKITPEFFLFMKKAESKLNVRRAESMMKWEHDFLEGYSEIN